MYTTLTAFVPLWDLECAFLNLSEKINKEKEERAKLIESKEYGDIQLKIDNLKSEQDKILDSVDNSEQEFLDIKIGIIDKFSEGNIDNYGKLKAKFREEKKVNPNIVLEAFGGDIGLFMDFVKITQKDINNKIKEENKYGDRNVAKTLRGSIEVVSKEMTDIIIS